ncbi:hypothetical protein MSPP1_003798 [Malassezia sp. CBS 17886]|nr:hypothetical protein MSPP1_003798 [Malassezia sp. CBS 17886]
MSGDQSPATQTQARSTPHPQRILGSKKGFYKVSYAVWGHDTPPTAQAVRAPEWIAKGLVPARLIDVWREQRADRRAYLEKQEASIPTPARTGMTVATARPATAPSSVLPAQPASSSLSDPPDPAVAPGLQASSASRPTAGVSPRAAALSLVRFTGTARSFPAARIPHETTVPAAVASPAVQNAGRLSRGRVPRRGAQRTQAVSLPWSAVASSAQGMHDEVEQLRMQKDAMRDELAFLRNMYDEASSKAAEAVAELDKVRQENAQLHTRMDSGIAFVRGLVDAEKGVRERQNTQQEAVRLLLATQQTRIPPDVVHKAAEFDRLRAREARAEEERRRRWESWDARKEQENLVFHDASESVPPVDSAARGVNAGAPTPPAGGQVPGRTAEQLSACTSFGEHPQRHRSTLQEELAELEQERQQYADEMAPSMGGRTGRRRRAAVAAMSAVGEHGDGGHVQAHTCTGGDDNRAGVSVETSRPGDVEARTDSRNSSYTRDPGAFVGPPVGLPAELAAELSATLPAELPAEAGLEPPAALPAELPAETVLEPPAALPAELPAETVLEPPAALPAELPAETVLEPPAALPAELSAELSAALSAELPAATTFEPPTPQPTALPIELPASALPHPLVHPSPLSAPLPAEATPAPHRAAASQAPRWKRRRVAASPAHHRTVSDERASL